MKVDLMRKFKLLATWRHVYKHYKHRTHKKENLREYSAKVYLWNNLPTEMIQALLVQDSELQS